MSRSPIPLYKAHIPPGAAGVLQDVLDSGQIAGDGTLPAFEEGLRRFIGTDYVAATAEFSRSIEMALRMAGVGPGDSVLLSPLACLATTMPLLNAGVRPVWCDVDPASGGMRAEEIAKRRQASTKAVLIYHWVGVPGDIQSLLGAAAENGLSVVEDAGESFGAECGGKRVGAHGSDYTVFSFSPVRHLTTGEGAAITFRDADQLNRARAWRKYGIPATGFRDSQGEINRDCDIQIPGLFNCMNRLAGALGCAQMEYADNIVAAHRSNGAFFDARLRDIPGVRLLSLPQGTIPSYWVYCFLCERRQELMTTLKQTGIHASTVHVRNDSYSCFGTGPADLPGIADFERRQLCIPCGWWVTEDEREYIVNTIQRGW